MRSDSEQLQLEALEQPKWASAFGRDRYGLWADIALEHVTRRRRFGILSPRRKESRKVTQRVRWIAPGQMTMGSPAGEDGRFENEGPQHLVTLSEGYWLFDTPCTQELWQVVMGENPSRFQDPLRPVESIDWSQTSEFSSRLSEQVPQLVFRLPTEAQWEYACRAGTTSAIYTGELKILGDANAPELDAIAWYGGNSGVEYDLDDGEALGYLSDKQYSFEKSGTRCVKLKKPNIWGLYDMLGNVWEWCRDGERSYDEESIADPIGPTEEGAGRVIRGGGWSNRAQDVRAAYRSAVDPGGRGGNLGFRCVCVQAPNEVSASRGVEGRDGPETQRTQ
ncbi:MAG: formylglycine-generating enzyme family protein [Planctomycetes bacterium]|nr:formylglycine-generating enzyme family protein [Planctomycetota bacterium]